MSRGPIAVVGWLAVVTALIIAVAVALVLILGLVPAGGRHGVVGQVFSTLLHALDPGTVAGDAGRWPFLLVELGVTLAGLFVVSALIGVIATALELRLMQLRKGRSFVIERDHTLILGWSEAIVSIVGELALANESEHRPSVVILADRDKTDMEDTIRERVDDLRGTRLVCRTGSPIDLRDLAIANPRAARSIIVLAPDAPYPDAEVIKTILALTRGTARPDGRPHRIVAEIEDSANLEAARLVGGDATVLLDKRETIAKLMVQSSRQSGASAVYTELLDFAGEEIYFRADPEQTGRTYADALLAYEDAAVMGLQRAAGEVLVNPPPATRIAAGDRVIAVAEDDSVLERAEPWTGRVDEAVIADRPRAPSAPRRILLLGWNRRAATVLNELDDYVAPGSTLTVLTSVVAAADDVARECEGLRRLTVTVGHGDITARRTLAGADPGAYERVIVLSEIDEADPARADARTLITLLHLRDLVDGLDPPPTIVSEMLDPSNHELARVTKVDDVIVSDTVTSLLLAQISENPHLATVFATLFDAEGSEIYIRPVTDYLAPGAGTTFATAVAAASRRGESAIGLRLAAEADDPDAGYGVRLNPRKSASWTPAEGDRLIVLAEE
jgi:voltage-gated potassium channel Kch